MTPRTDEQRLFSRELRMLDEIQPERIRGTVRRINDLVIEAEGLSVPVGTVCHILPAEKEEPLETEVVAFRDEIAQLMPFGDQQGIKRNDPVITERTLQTIGVGPELLNRVIDARGNPIDDRGPLLPSGTTAVYNESPDPMKRPRITEPLSTGIRAIDGLLTIGKGQRIGLFSGSGVGKSVLLGMIARNIDADVTVIALVGERGREVRDFIEKNLDEESRQKTVIVVATSDEPPLMRVEAPFTASAIAEYFRDQGKDVMLLMDSLTRMCHAQREIGLSVGQPPATRGYPPSVFHKIPELVERSGTNENGSITGIYTVLVEADDIDEPISDTARSVLDGHIWLERDLAEQGHYPAIDPVQSVSRLMREVTDEQHQEAAVNLNGLLSTYREAEDLINIGAYVEGSNPDIDTAVNMIDDLNDFLTQSIDEGASFEQTRQELLELHEESKQIMQRARREQQNRQQQNQSNEGGSNRAQGQSGNQAATQQGQVEPGNRPSDQQEPMNPPTPGVSNRE